MRNKNIFYKIVIIILLSWSVITTYFSANDMNIVDWLGTHFKKSKSFVNIDIEEEYHVLQEFLEKYYKIDGRTSRFKKIQDIKSMILEIEQPKILSRYKHSLDSFYSKNRKQNFTLHKVLRDQRNGLYTCYLSIYQTLLSKREYFVKLELKFSPLPKRYISFLE